MLIWYFSNNLDIYDYAGKLPEQHFSVWLFSNLGDKILFLLKFHKARISEWNISCKVGRFSLPFDTLKVTISQRYPNGRTDRQTTRLVELL